MHDETAHVADRGLNAGPPTTRLLDDLNQAGCPASWTTGRTEVSVLAHAQAPMAWIRTTEAACEMTLGYASDPDEVLDEFGVWDSTSTFVVASEGSELLGVVRLTESEDDAGTKTLKDLDTVLGLRPGTAARRVRPTLGAAEELVDCSLLSIDPSVGGLRRARVLDALLSAGVFLALQLDRAGLRSAYTSFNTVSFLDLVTGSAGWPFARLPGCLGETLSYTLPCSPTPLPAIAAACDLTDLRRALIDGRSAHLRRCHTWLLDHAPDLVADHAG